MIYNEFKGLMISDLGFDTKRLPITNDDNSYIDEERSEELINYALAHGVNYYDTASDYHEGKAASFLGSVLSKHPRDSFFIAHKFPGHESKSISETEEIFEAQLEECRVEYFDFYLVQNVDEASVDSYISPSNKVMEYLIGQKNNGRIRHLGMHTNGKIKAIERFLRVYREYIEFAQMQLNYLDWSLLGAKERLEFLRDNSLPIWVTGPLRNGQLTKLEKAYEDTLKCFRPNETAVGWAYRFVQSTAAVKTIISGFSDLEQLKSDLALFEDEVPLLNGKEAAILLSIVNDALSKRLINCTACRNCTEYCEHHLDIPTLIDLYNEYKLTHSVEFITRPWSTIPEDKMPSHCYSCGACEKVCPQNIKVSEIMKVLSEIMRDQEAVC